jgi:hypothetical protein
MRSLSKRPLGAIFLCVFSALSQAQPATAKKPSDGADGPGLLARTWADATDMQAWRGAGLWRGAIAPWAPHFRPSEEHRRVWAIAVERQRPDDWFAGFSYFRNSFGQPSAYAYVGKRFNRLWGVEPLFFQASGGVLYGYKGKYKDKVALNVGGFAPGALVGLGWQLGERSSATLHLMGDAGVMLQLSYDFR